MTVLAAGAVSITDGAIVIPAETVARRLGLKLEALQAEMKRGKVSCPVETDVGLSPPNIPSIRSWSPSSV